MIAGSPTEYSTICAALKTVQEISKHLQQSTAAVITFELTIYYRAKEIHWRYPEEFQNLVIYLRGGGGSDCTQLFGLDRKDVFQGSGLEDVFIESGLYGSSSAMALLQGKSYNNGIKGHKLIMEVLLRLKWDAFCSWVSKGGGGGVESEGGSILNLANSVIERYRTATRAEEKKEKEVYLLLSNTATHAEDLLPRLKQESSSKLFKYIEMILLLLDFIRA